MCVCVLQDLVSPASYLTHMPFFKYRTHLRQLCVFVPRAHGLTSASNKKVFDVYGIMQPRPLGAVDTGDITGIKCRD